MTRTNQRLASQPDLSKALSSEARPHYRIEAALPPYCKAVAGRAAFLFTDLIGSTALYDRMGDPAAYRIVRRHLVFLAGIVSDHAGAVVKTIGDAVMAAFGSPADAVEAALAMQARVADFNLAHAREIALHGLAIKLGGHFGSSVRVEHDNRLDYFGLSVNMAARLQRESQGGEIVLSRVLADHPTVRPLLARVPTREESLALRGFDRQVGIVRVLPPRRPAIVRPLAVPSFADRQ